MKLSKETVNVLSNFAGINSNLYIQTGDRITTVANTSNILAEAIVEETFPCDVKLWDTGKMLNIIGMFSDAPDVTFEDKSLRVTSGVTEVELLYSDPNLLVFQHETLGMETPLVAIDITENLLHEAIKASAILEVSNVNFSCTDGVASLNVFDASSNDSDNVTFDITEQVSDTSKDFELNFRSGSLIVLIFIAYTCINNDKSINC